MPWTEGHAYQQVFVAEDGDRFEPERVYREHGNWLMAFLRRRFGHQDAEDFAQETYLRAVSVEAHVRNPRAFLVRIALNVARDQIRRRNARPVLVREGAPVLDEASQAEALLLKQAILALPPKLQEVFLLSRFAGLTYEEIAHRCGISVKTVEGRMTKALAMCTALME